jgi:hypothetical protein
VPFVVLDGFANPVPDGDAGLEPLLPAAPSVAVVSAPAAAAPAAAAPAAAAPPLELDEPEEPLLPPPPARGSRRDEREFDDASCG